MHRGWEGAQMVPRGCIIGLVPICSEERLFFSILWVALYAPVTDDHRSSLTKSSMKDSSSKQPTVQELPWFSELRSQNKHQQGPQMWVTGIKGKEQYSVTGLCYLFSGCALGVDYQESWRPMEFPPARAIHHPLISCLHSLSGLSSHSFLSPTDFLCNSRS